MKQSTGVAQVDFLLARLEEDLAKARDAADGPWSLGDYQGRLLGGSILDRHGETALAAAHGGTLHYALHFDPHRIERLVAAKNSIVQLCTAEDSALAWHVLGELTREYADHPDFRPEWVLDAEPS